MREVIVKRLCREHGGNFISPKRRGRPPTSCAPDYPCTAAETHIPDKPKRIRVHTTLEHETPTSAPQSPVEPRSQPSEGLSKAKAAKEALEGQGWTVEGRANGERVSVTGARGEEIVSLVWSPEGELQSQEYSLWNTVRVSANGAPKANLPFDPDEIPDARLIPYLTGMSVTWHNRLSGGSETAVIGERIEIMHVYDRLGEELPADRLIRFIDATGRGFRHFRLGALLKIGRGATVFERQEYAKAMGKDDA